MTLHFNARIPHDFPFEPGRTAGALIALPALQNQQWILSDYYKNHTLATDDMNVPNHVKLR